LDADWIGVFRRLIEPWNNHLARTGRESVGKRRMQTRDAGESSTSLNEEFPALKIRHIFILPAVFGKSCNAPSAAA
jgi:hypothetical protein